MSFIKEFKEFATRGNVVDLAVGVITGTAFGKIISSLVNDIIMPPIGLLTNGVDFSKAKYVLKEAVGKKPETTINYGMFINNVVDFLIVAFVIFLMIKGVNALRRKQEAEPVPPPPPAPPSKEEELLTQIRDLLAKDRQ